MKRAPATFPLDHLRDLAIMPEHRSRPGWQWLWDRLLRPLPTEQPSESGTQPPASERLDEPA